MYFLSSSVEENTPLSKSTNCSRLCNTLNCKICEPDVCKTSCITCLVEKHTYCVLKNLCRKIITELGREQCRERYSVFDGGRSLNNRLYKTYKSCFNHPFLCTSEGSICGKYQKSSEIADDAGSEKDMHRKEFERSSHGNRYTANKHSQEGNKYLQFGFEDDELVGKKKLKAKDKSKPSRTSDSGHPNDEHGLKYNRPKKMKGKKGGTDSDEENGDSKTYRIKPKDKSSDNDKTTDNKNKKKSKKLPETSDEESEDNNRKLKERRKGRSENADTGEDNNRKLKERKKGRSENAETGDESTGKKGKKGKNGYNDEENEEKNPKLKERKNGRSVDTDYGDESAGKKDKKGKSGTTNYGDELNKKIGKGKPGDTDNGDESLEKKGKKKISGNTDNGGDSLEKKGKKKKSVATDNSDEFIGNKGKLGKKEIEKDDQNRIRDRDKSKKKTKRDTSDDDKNEHNEIGEKRKDKSKRKQYVSGSEDESIEEQKRKNKSEGKKGALNDRSGVNEVERKQKQKTTLKAIENTEDAREIESSGKNKTRSKYEKNEADSGDKNDKRKKELQRVQGAEKLNGFKTKHSAVVSNLRKSVRNSKNSKYNKEAFCKEFSDEDMYKRIVCVKKPYRFRSIKRNLFYRDFQLVKSRLDEIKFCDVLRCDLEQRELLKERKTCCFGCSCCNVCCPPNFHH